MQNVEEIPALVLAADPDIADDPVNERLLEDEDTGEENLRYEISSYGADYDVDGLVRRLRSGDIKIPSFQRGYVWPLKQASRFIESLLLGLPVPGVFFSREPETNKLLVIDGQQRLTTLLAFYDGIFPTTKREFSLTDVQEGLVGKTYRTIEDQYRRVLDNAIIHATVVKQTDPQDGGSGIYKIFERLNSSGMLLSPQEIRTAIYGGRLSDLLSELNRTATWRDLFGPVNKRMRDQELILRFLALFQREKEYQRPMKTFLNDFMKAERELSSELREQLTRAFCESIDLIHSRLGLKAFKPSGSFNAAVFDAILIAVARRLEKGEVKDGDSFLKAYNTTISNPDFLQWTSRSTADDETLRKRLEFAQAMFSTVI